MEILYSKNKDIIFYRIQIIDEDNLFNLNKITEAEVYSLELIL